jgi:hypothetical protein
MHHHFKVRLILLAFCLMAVAASQISEQSFARGFREGIASTDQDAFDAYVHFARQMHVETHKTAKAHDAQTVWAALSMGK